MKDSKEKLEIKSTKNCSSLDWKAEERFSEPNDMSMISLVAQWVQEMGSIPGLSRFPGGGHGNLLQYSCPENPHGQRSLAGCSPWSHKKSDMTEQLNTTQWYVNRYFQNWNNNNKKILTGYPKAVRQPQKM